MSCTWDFCALHYDIPARKGSIFHRKAICFHQMWWHTEHCIASPASEVVSEKKDQSEVRPGCKWFGRSPRIRGWAAGDKVSGLTWKANKGLQQLQPNGSFASSAEQGRPVSSTFWVTLRVHVGVLELYANTALTLHWMFTSAIQQHFFPFQCGNHRQLVLSVSFSHPCKAPKCGIVSWCEGY